MAYTLFGSGPADITSNANGEVVGGVEFRVYTAPSGGVRITDLLDVDGAPLPGLVTSQPTAEDTSDIGRIRFQAPDDHYVLYLDRGYGDRWQVIPSKLGETVAASVDASSTALTQSQQAIDNAAAALAVARAQVDVRMYGAVGDGVTDDTGAFRAAIEAIELSGGGTLFVPPLRYRLADHVPLCSNLYVEGWGATFVKHTGSRSSYAYFSALSNGSVGYGSGCRNVRVAGITFTGDFQSSVDTCGFALHHAQDVTIEQCSFVQVQGPGHCIDLAGCDSIIVRQCRFEGFMEAAAGSGYRRAEAVQIDISALGALSELDEPGSHDGLFTRNVTVEDCDFSTLTVNNVNYPAPNPIGSHASREGVVAENIILRGCRVGRMTADQTSEWRGGVHFAGVRGLTIENNTFVTSGNARVIGLYTVSTGTPATHDPNQGSPPSVSISPVRVQKVRVVGNRFTVTNASTANVQELIFVQGASNGRASGVEVAGNVFVVDMRLGEMLRFENTEDVTVRDNHGSGVHMALVVRTSRRVVVSGNRWVGSPQTPQSFSGQPTEQFVTVVGATISGETIESPLDQGIWIGTSCEDISIDAVKVINPSSLISSRGLGVAIASATRFSLTNCKLTTNNTIANGAGVSVYGGSSRGFVTGNVISGYDSLVVTDTVTEVITTGNI